MPFADVERHRGRVGVQRLARLGHDDLVARVADPRAGAGGLRDRLQSRAAREQHAPGGDRARRGLDAGDDPTAAASGAGAEPGERHALAQLDAGALHRQPVRAYVPRWIDPAVGRDVRPAAEAASPGHRRDQPSDLVGADPSGVEARLALHRDALARRALVGGRGREDHVAATDEAGVRAVPLLLPFVEADRPRTQPDRVGRPPCARTMPAARLDAPRPARSRSIATTRPRPPSRAKTDAHPPTVPAPTTTRSAASRATVRLLPPNPAPVGAEV